MEYDKDKVDEMILALLSLTTFEDDFGWRAWKSMDWGAMNRLHEKGYISNPKSKAKSVAVETSYTAPRWDLQFFRVYGKLRQP